MAETFNKPELEETRYISGRGLFRVPFTADTRRIYLQCSVLRDPNPNYVNNRYNFSKGFYATILWYKGGYVVREDVMEYELQRFEWIADITAQAIYQANCGYLKVIEWIRYLGEQLEIDMTPTPGRVFYPLNDFPEEIRIVCRDGCAVTVELWRQLIDKCPSYASDDRVPEVPDPPPEKLPPGSPLDGNDGRPNVSPPYDGEDDQGDTIPYDPDEFPPPEPPEYEACTKLVIAYKITFVGGASVVSTGVVYAPFGGVRVAPGSLRGIQQLSRGSANGVCLPTQDWRPLDATSIDIASVEVVDVFPQDEI